MDEKLYNTIGRNYNTTRHADNLIAETLLKLLSPNKDQLYLDIGCGTGNYTSKLAEKGYQFWGVDPSELMLMEAKSKSNQINWQIGTSNQIPADDQTFSGAIATLTIHHWLNLEESFIEIFRVLKPKSNFVIFSSYPEQMEGYWLEYYFPKMIKYSAVKMPTFEAIKITAEKAGFKIVTNEKYFVQENLSDLFLYSGKFNPEIYFNKQIQNGISSFGLWSNENEIENGFRQLRSDIDSGKFTEIKNKYSNNLGDYIFITLNK